MSKKEDTTINKDDLETKVNEYLSQMHSTTITIMGDYPAPKDVMAYMLALGTHFSELMWANKVSLDMAKTLYEEVFRSTYEQCAEMLKDDEGDKDEKAK